MIKYKTATEFKAALKAKQAELDALDDQLLGMDEAMPMDVLPNEEFDLLTQKREELEEDIRTMREGVQLITEWEKFKGGQWSEEVKMQLNAMDNEIANAAGPQAAAPPVDLGTPMPPEAGTAPAAPLPPATPEPGLEAPPAPEVPAPTEEVAPEVPPVEEPAMAPTASSKSAISKKNNYEDHNKKGNIARETPIMANKETKPSLKEGLASQKLKTEAIKKESQSRVASAWTIAKTMLPTAPAKVQVAFAKTLLANPTNVITACLRQTAVNAHYSKVADEFKKVHKVEMNDLLEDPSVLTKERSAVESELKGAAKEAAATKVADDRKDAGPQTETYNDGRGCGGGTHTEPKETDAGTSASETQAENRPLESVDKSTEGSNKVSAAKATPKAGESCAECKKLGKACPKCASVTKKADEPVQEMPLPEGEAVPPVEGEMPPAEGEMPPAAEVPPGEEGKAEEGATVLTEEKKLDIHEKIDEAEQAIQSLEEEILEEGNEELNIENIFNEEEMEDKAASLANEGDNHAAGDDNDFFAPSAAAEMEAGMEDHFGSMDEIFSMQGADADPLAALIAGDLHTAAQIEGMEVLESFSGQLESHFNEMSGETRTNESDHEEDILSEAAEAVKVEEQGMTRVKQDQTNVLELPAKASAAKKTAAAKPAVIKHLKPRVGATTPRVVNPVAAALFGDGDNF